jgi:hypothetical protein
MLAATYTSHKCLQAALGHMQSAQAQLEALALVLAAMKQQGYSIWEMQGRRVSLRSRS